MSCTNKLLLTGLPGCFRYYSILWGMLEDEVAFHLASRLLALYGCSSVWSLVCSGNSIVTEVGVSSSGT